MNAGLAFSGDQYEIREGEQRATIVEVGGGIREYSVAGRDVLDPYPLQAMCDGAHGAPLIPWPNRLADGRYTFDGQEHQVALSEPERHNAIHGFLRWRSWSVFTHEGASVTVGCRLLPLAGYPFALDIRITYALGAGGLSVQTTARNIGARRCPFAAGQHPYLSGGGGKIDDCELELGASTRILVDDERKLPCGTEPVADGTHDFRRPRRIGSQEIDSAFSDLKRDQDGLVNVALTAPDGTSVHLWADGSYPVIELYTGDALSVERRRRGLGVEPMTCAPNGFASGEGLTVLEPGEEHHSRWGVCLR
jgi:aldose 1-epimerase